MLLARKRTESFSIKEFMNRENEKKVILESDKKKMFEMGFMGGVTIPLATALMRTPAYASSNEVITVTASETANAMYDKMLHAFDPLITLVQALAYPIAMVVVLGGALFIMIGNKEKGFSMMQGAGLGYVLVQMTPLVLNILVDAMKMAV
ncbi:hypothetical protein [Bacillus litorisediminis]|uniref:hypothetical protein n=1 Tax=Bacillus litorisediminis TaxID=2922713 RepID=UPI001FB02AA5|nr:hypothetical protein [Bacillus litorisediminis]